MTNTTREAVEQIAQWIEIFAEDMKKMGAECGPESLGVVAPKRIRALLAAKEDAEAEVAALREGQGRAPVSVGEAAKVLLVAQSYHAKNPYPQNMGPLNQLPATALRALAYKGGG